MAAGWVARGIWGVEGRGPGADQYRRGHTAHAPAPAASNHSDASHVVSVSNSSNTSNHPNAAKKPNPADAPHASNAFEVNGGRWIAGAGSNPYAVTLLPAASPWDF